MKALWFAIYVVVMIVAVCLVGTWTLIPGIGIPLLVLASRVMSSLGHAQKIRIVEARMKAAHLAGSRPITPKTRAQAIEIAARLKTRVDQGRGVLHSIGLLQLSNKYLGYFLSHLLDPSEQPDKVFNDVAISLMRGRPLIITGSYSPKSENLIGRPQMQSRGISRLTNFKSLRTFVQRLFLLLRNKWLYCCAYCI